MLLRSLSKPTKLARGDIARPGSVHLSLSHSIFSSDLWALGCVVYQMICGKFAFHGLSEYLVLQKVKNMDYSFPDGFDSDAKDFVQKLLV